jgi:hypothetical protein
LRRLPIERRKQTLAKLVGGPKSGIVVNEHYEGGGDIVYQHACKLGCEGIVSKRLGSTYRFGRGAGSAARGGRGLGALTPSVAPKPHRRQNRERLGP